MPTSWKLPFGKYISIECAKDGGIKRGPDGENNRFHNIGAKELKGIPKTGVIHGGRKCPGLWEVNVTRQFKSSYRSEVYQSQEDESAVECNVVDKDGLVFISQPSSDNCYSPDRG